MPESTPETSTTTAAAATAATATAAPTRAGRRLLEVDNVTLRFGGVVALNEVNFHIYPDGDQNGPFLAFKSGKMQYAQIPTGQVTTVPRMRALASVLDRHGVPRRPVGRRVHTVYSRSAC